MKHIVPAVAVTLLAGLSFAGNGSDEAGFVPPPHAKKCFRYW
jgi:hypothetical protein